MPVDFDRTFSTLEADPDGRVFFQDGIHCLGDGVTIWSATKPARFLADARTTAIAQVKRSYEDKVGVALIIGDYSYDPLEISRAIDARATTGGTITIAKTTVATGESEPVVLDDADFDVIAVALLTRNNAILSTYRGYVTQINVAVDSISIQTILESMS